MQFIKYVKEKGSGLEFFDEKVCMIGKFRLINYLGTSERVLDICFIYYQGSGYNIDFEYLKLFFLVVHALTEEEF